jgi:hypothetical protein
MELACAPHGQGSRSGDRRGGWTSAAAALLLIEMEYSRRSRGRALRCAARAGVVAAACHNGENGWRERWMQVDEVDMYTSAAIGV